MARLGWRFPIASSQVLTQAIPGDPYFNNVVALLHCDGTNGSTTFTDLSPLKANWTPTGATISTTQSKFGGAAASLSTTTYAQASAASSNFAFGTSDFTIEMWLYATVLSGFQSFYDQRPSGANAVSPQLYTSGTTLLYLVNGANVINGGTLATATWYHIALCRVGTSTKLFVNGTQAGSTYTDSNNYVNATARPVLGSALAPGSSGWQGYLDEIRITKGVGRYAGSFTAPTAPFPNYPLR